MLISDLMIKKVTDNISTSAVKSNNLHDVNECVCNDVILRKQQHAVEWY